MSSGVAATTRDGTFRLGVRAVAWLRTRALELCAVSAFAAGAVGRYVYIVLHHHPRAAVISDAMSIANLAELLTDPEGHQQFFHTIWPPGMSAFLGLTLVFDPTLGLAAVLQCLASIAIPVLAFQSARWAYGERAGWVALLLASAHFGLVHYGGFFLSEQLFQLTVAVAVCASIATVRAGRGAMPGVTAGAAWALATLFRPNAMPVAIFAAGWMAVRWLRKRQLRERRALIIAGLAAALLVMLPLAHRCSSLVGRFCPVSSNFAMNVALGHAQPGIAGLTFAPQSAELSTGPNTWNPPARQQLGYGQLGQVPASIYDTGAVLGWVADRFIDDPIEFALGSLGNAIDLFGAPYWPDDYADLQSRHVLLMKQAVFVFILVPGLAFFGLQLLRLVRRRDVGEVTSLLVSIVLGLFALSCVSLGEARYRLPFDIVFIVFAAQAFIKTASHTVEEPAAIPPRLFSIAAPALLVSCLLLVAVAHPQVRLAAQLRGLAPASPAPIAETVSWESVSVRRPQGTPWDAPGNHAYACRDTACGELRVTLPALQDAPAIEVSTDHNDRYRATFYRGGEAVGSAAWGIFEAAPPGLQATRVEVPASARDGGFDSVGIRPLYGDGRYAIGHLVPLAK